ncbi:MULTISPECIES: aminotransferase A [Bacillaceae]|uniref:Aminotransferase n=1 Tax=Domibacillus aminovorans TaxID=29332 RepID=A0A177KJS2_9BACI|nr:MULTISPECIES: aminotransferase A [Bacillaceae]OAH53619.1 aromatic amino acid aminotransferase [Domibacillus aminovorans]
MEHRLNERVKEIEISGIRKFFNLVGTTENMISLTIGQPDFHTSDHVKAAGIQAIEQNATVYTPNAGLPELKKAAAEFYKQKYDVSYNAESEVIVTVGASQAIDIALRTILQPGDEVIVPGPVYPGYEPIIHLCEAKTIMVDTTKNDFRITAALIEQSLTRRTKAIILPYPSNPTGVSLTDRELQDIAQLAKKHELFILADEIYSEIIYERPHVSIASYLPEQTIVINGLSKSHAMTGWRIGLLFASEIITRHILKVHQYNVSCASSVSQKAAIAALTAGIDDAIPMREEYKIRRDTAYDKIQTLGLKTVKPDGAFYFFVKLPDDFSGSSFDFCLTLAKEYKVAVVPGSAFSPAGEGWFRLSYACSIEDIQEGLARIEQYLNHLKK